MSKSIIHMRIPTNEDGEILCPFDNVQQTAKYVENNLPDDCCLIVTPFDIDVITGNQKIIRIDYKEYSYDEMTEIINKAWQYDELNK